jgi:hypothetical protein
MVLFLFKLLFMYILTTIKYILDSTELKQLYKIDLLKRLLINICINSLNELDKKFAKRANKVDENNWHAYYVYRLTLMKGYQHQQHQQQQQQNHQRRNGKPQKILNSTTVEIGVGLQNVTLFDITRIIRPRATAAVANEHKNRYAGLKLNASNSNGNHAETNVRRSNRLKR